MIYVIYFVLAISATTLGSLTGTGGGVIMKPVMDMLGHFDVASIGIISSVTVFSMSLVSVTRQIISKRKIPYDIAIPVSAGAVAGGYLGQWTFAKVMEKAGEGSNVKVIQNIILCFLILFVFIYVKNKEKFGSFHLKGIFPAALTGILLGVLASFLGIGGGPINVAVIILLFSCDTKTATVCSLMTILFAQLSKLITVALTSGFGDYSLTVVPVMIAGAVAGGFIGAALNRKLSEKAVERAFSAVQIIVLGITISNIIRNLI